MVPASPEDSHRTTYDKAGIARSAAEAKRLLVGRDAPFSPAEGVALLKARAARDDADALCVLATLRAGGAWTHHSWPEALDLLQRAAECGSPDARTSYAWPRVTGCWLPMCA